MAPIGGAAALRLHDLPEHGVVDVAAAVVLDDLAHVFGDGAEVLDQVLGRLRAEFGVLLDRAVQVGDVGLVVLVVVQLHGRFVDVGLEGGVVVGKRGKFECHAFSPVVMGCARGGQRVIGMRGPGIRLWSGDNTRDDSAGGESRFSRAAGQVDA